METDDLAGLAAATGVDQPGALGVEGVRVGLGAPADHGLTLSPGSLDHDPVPASGDRIGGEGDAGLVRRDHALDDDRAVGERVRSALGAVGHRSRREHPPGGRIGQALSIRIFDGPGSAAVAGIGMRTSRIPSL
jgi:hypothetical protein